jgi:hypothetical protein
MLWPWCHCGVANSTLKFLTNFYSGLRLVGFLFLSKTLDESLLVLRLYSIYCICSGFCWMSDMDIVFQCKYCLKTGIETYSIRKKMSILIMIQIMFLLLFSGQWPLSICIVSWPMFTWRKWEIFLCMKTRCIMCRMWFQKGVGLKTATSAVRNAYFLCINACFHGMFIYTANGKTLTSNKCIIWFWDECCNSEQGNNPVK